MENPREDLAQLLTLITILTMTDLLGGPRGLWRRRSLVFLVMTIPSLLRCLTQPLSAMGWWREVTTLMLRPSVKCFTSVVMTATVD